LRGALGFLLGRLHVERLDRFVFGLWCIHVFGNGRVRRSLDGPGRAANFGDGHFYDGRGVRGFGGVCILGHHFGFPGLTIRGCRVNLLDSLVLLGLLGLDNGLKFEVLVLDLG
jgi:hypothetical protein